MALNITLVYLTYRYWRDTKRLADIAEIGQKAEETRWIAENKPFLDIRFLHTWEVPESLRNDPKLRELTLISIENKGKLRCRIVECKVGEFVIDGHMVFSSLGKEKQRFINSVIESNELQIFYSDSIRDAAFQYAQDGDDMEVFPLTITYDFDPNKRTVFTRLMKSGNTESGIPLLTFANLPGDYHTIDTKK